MDKGLIILGKTIKNERKRKGLTQTQLAQLSGSSINFISQVEAGKERAQISKLLDVLDVLGFEFKLQWGKGRISIAKEIV